MVVRHIYNYHRKPHMESQKTLSHLTLSDLERLKSRCLIPCKGAELVHMLLLNINRKPHLWGVQWHYQIWPWTTLKGQIKSRSQRFGSLISCKGAGLGHKFILNIYRKIYMGSPLVTLHLTLVTLKSQYQGHSFQSLISCKGAELGHM